MLILLITYIGNHPTQQSPFSLSIKYYPAASQTGPSYKEEGNIPGVFVNGETPGTIQRINTLEKISQPAAQETK